MYTTIFLRSNNGQYLCAEDGGGGVLVANRMTPSSWETFAIVDPYGPPLNSGNRVSIQTYNGHYVCAEGGGGGEVNATRDQPLDWETFTVLHADGSAGEIGNEQQIALQASNGQYLSAVDGGGREILANASAVNIWETFTVQVLESIELFIALNSNMGAGHFMNTRGAMRNGHLDAVTRTYTVTQAGGFTGAVQLLFEDRAGIGIGGSQIHPFGVSGRIFGNSDSTYYWSEDIDPDLAARVTRIHATHFWQPRYDFFENLINRAIAAGRPIVDLIVEIKQNGGDAN